MVLRLTALLTTVLCWGILADEGESRGKLIGTWQVQGHTSETGVVAWSLRKEGDIMRITRSLDGRKAAEFACNTVGKECTSKESGHEVKVTMWYNGSMLVELEATRNELVKYRFSISGDADGMQLEVIPISPGGKTETIQLKRVNVAQAQQ